MPTPRRDPNERAYRHALDEASEPVELHLVMDNWRRSQAQSRQVVADGGRAVFRQRVGIRR